MSNSEAPLGSKRKSRASDKDTPSTNHVKRHTVPLSEPVMAELAPECAAGIVVKFRDVTAAAYRTKSGIQKTPLVVSI